MNKLVPDNEMPWVPSHDKARVDAALRTLRPLVPMVSSELERAWGSEWKVEMYRRLRTPASTPLEDIRFLLRIIGTDHKLDPNPVRHLFPDLPPTLADSLRALANKAQHEDATWTPGDADRAEHLALAILTCTRPIAAIAVASVRGHHQEVFRVERGWLFHRWFPERKESWSEWHVMEAARASSVAAVGSDDNRLDLFVLAEDGRIEHRTWWDDRGWEPLWKTLPLGGQAVTGTLAALSREPGHLEVFATGETGDPVHRWAWNEDWSPWHRFSTPTIC
jgi:hypothetical protein